MDYKGNKEYRKKLLMGKYSNGTRYGYGSKAKRIIESEGELGYWEFISYMRKSKRAKAGTLRGYKAAMLLVMKLEDPSHALSESLSMDLDELLDGREVLEAKENPRQPRGAIDEKKLRSLVTKARGERSVRGNRLADGFLVANGCGMRGGSLKELTAGDVHLEEGYIMAPRKGRELVKAREGYKEEHIIATTEAEMVLRRRCQGLKANDCVFKDWNDEEANAFVQETAKREKWPTTLKWDGMHCHRHGAAVRAKKAVLEAVKKIGPWKTDASATHYSRLGRK